VKLTVLFLVIASTAVAQNLAPEVILLARIKAHLREELSRVPNYTCLETVSRFRKGERAGDARWKPLDRVALEIVYANGKEYYGSPGAREINVDNPGAFVGSGMIGNGMFALTLNNIIEGARFKYSGEELDGGRALVRYEFQIPRILKGLFISLPGGQGMVGEEGSILADKSSLDLVRVESGATEIPAFLPLREMMTDVRYARTRIGEHDVLLAQQADIGLAGPDRVEDFDRFEFTHCRAYSAEADIRFDNSSGEPQDASSAEFSAEAGTLTGTSRSIPALLAVTVELETSISDKDPVGKLIEGKVAGDVRRKGKIVIPARATVRGRIRRLERYDTGRSFIVGLEFTEIEVQGRIVPFYADLLRIDKNPLIVTRLSERIWAPGTGGMQTEANAVTLRELPGVASFFVGGASFKIGAGFRTTWRTRGPIR
jgi:hypothetical protein